MTKFQAPRGTHDVLPRDHLWWRMIRTIEEQCVRYGWSRVSTPGFEDTALFERTAGEASDVVHKEMYTFEDRGERSITLRPEGTAPIARAYVEHGLAQEPQPVKAY
ncbi:MAG TPA: ATP phosphoribosyltransferase regulatory subunit, partial [Gaiellaceae bacterium]|nr:ATP phosphoribosyltransferase regulatory subunit [Gaiellaceae bacterium]